MENKTFSRLVPLGGGINFRDLGGYRSRDGRTLKWRKLLRCGHLAALTDADLDALEAMGVSRVHDFRREDEQSQSPTRSVRAEIIDDYQMSIGDISRFWEFLAEGALSAETSHQLVVNSYRNCIETVIPAYSRFMRYLVDTDGGVDVFHCSAGKDRTGMAAALVLAALDIPRRTIVEDYLLTLEYYNSDKLIAIVEGHLRDAGVEKWDRSWLIPYCSVHADNINGFLDAIDQSYGNIKNYLEQGLGISSQDLEKLKDKYLQSD